MSKTSDFLRGILDIPLMPINAYREYNNQSNTTDIYPINRGAMRVRRQPDYLSLTGREPNNEHIELRRTIDLSQPPVRAKINTERWNRPSAPPAPAAPEPQTVASAPSYGKDPKLGLSNFRRVDKPRSLNNL